MKYWLMKTEPEDWSWKQQVKSGNKGAEWNGIRNFQAAKNLRNMKKGDKCFFYHTGKEKRIVGIVTTGKGITVHALDCFSLEKFNDMPEMWLEISWDREGDTFHKGSLVTVLANEPGSLAEITKIISTNNGNISNIQVISRDIDFYKFNIDLEIKNINHLNQIIAAMRLSQFVENVERGKD